MATPINGPLTNEIWHLSIDDLLEPTDQPPRLGGSGPFVINLSASSAPVSPPAKLFTAAIGAHVYQIQRVEDRRPRYRLRLGPFATEDQADAMLAIVRDVYPSALTATAESDDLRAIAVLKPKSEGAPPAAAPASRPSPGSAMTSIPVLSDSVEMVRRPAPTSAMAPPVAPRAAVAPAAAVAPRAVVAPSAAVAPRVVVAPSAAAAPRAVVAPSAAAAPRPAVAPSAAAAPRPAVAPRPTAPAVQAAVALRRADLPTAPRPSVESTQTLRALTASELQDSGARWYAIQLSLSGECFDPESLPNLDIFNEYPLYSVAGIDQGRIMHALRLGFFADEGAAAAVAHYLGAFYEKPTVKRISVAERERFKDQRVEARKDIGATGKHAVIEITGERHIRENRLRIATVTPLAPAAAGSGRISRD
ncbi:MAG: SPOR domain-containing protein [Steroidobacteraceae bacterium]